jgi:two-component sensor histidine kinase
VPSSKSREGGVRSSGGVIIKKIAAALGTRGFAVFDFYPPSAISPDDKQGWADLLGFGVDELPAHQEFFHWVVHRIDPASLSALRRAWRAFISGRTENFDATFQIRHKDGRWLSARGLGQSVARNGDNRLTHGIGAVVDVAQEDVIRHQQLTAAAETDAGWRRYGAIFASLSCIVFGAEVAGIRFTYINGFAEGLLGYAVSRWYEPEFFLNAVVDPADRAKVLQALSEASPTNPRIEVEFRAVTANGKRRWLKGLAQLDRDGTRSGRLIRGMLLDMSESRTLQESEKRLMEEIDHRAKNVLAVVQSMATLAYTSRTSPEGFLDALVRRIQALTRAHDQLAARRWKGVPLRELVAGEVRASDRGARSRIRIEGADLNLKPRAVQTLSLVLHELAFNAERHGALSVPDGSVHIAWSIVGGESTEMVDFRWEEHGAPAVMDRERSGFGALIMEHAVTHNLNASGKLEFGPAGVRYRLKVARAELAEDNGDERGELHDGPGQDSDR